MPLAEVTRSFSYKLNVGNYESRDFFCSQKLECEEADVEATSARLFEFCLKQVLTDVTAYKKMRDEMEAKRHQRPTSSPAA